MRNHFHSPWSKQIEKVERSMTVCNSCPFLTKHYGVKCALGYEVRMVNEKGMGDFPCSDSCELIFVSWRTIS